MVFHFNKKHLEDTTIPMWVIKTHGESFYVHHVTCELPWSTKETPDNSHTKGSIKIKECLLTIDEENSATISKLTVFDKVRLRNQKLGISRIIFSSYQFEQALKKDNIKHSPFKRISGGCGTAFTVCDLLDKKQVLLLQIKYPNDFRILKPNEAYYQAYDDKLAWEKLQNDYLDDEYPLDEDEER